VSAEAAWVAEVALDETDVVPLYHQLKERLRAVAGRMEPDTLMPSEKELMAYAGVSRATVRKAIADLVQEGVLYARQGRGTFTAPLRILTDLERPAGFTATMRRLGRTPATRVISVEKVPATAALAEQLQIGPGDEVIVFERLRLVDGEPAMLERTHVAASVAPGLAEKDLSCSFYELLAADYGLRPACGIELIVALNADWHLAKLLDVPIGSALLATARTSETDRGVPLEYTLRHARGDLCSFRVVLNQFSTLEDRSVVDAVLTAGARP
jgi:GntR family transcriptional regulator